MIEKFVHGLIKPLGRSLLVLTCISSLIGGSRPLDPAQPAEITLNVDTQTDSNDPAFQECTDQPDDCSLRGAITQANLDAPGEYVVHLPAGIYLLTLEGVRENDNASGDLDLYGRITLQGESAEDTILDANRIDRVLDIHSGARVEVQDITIHRGQAPHGAIPGAAGEHGGGILNRGELVLRDSMVRDNRAGGGAAGAIEIDGGKGGSGGGLFNLGVITIIGSTIRNNLSGNGGNGWQVCNWHCVLFPECINCTYPGDGGNGGGIFNKGVLYIEASAILSNTIGQPGNPTLCSHIWYGDCMYWDEWKSGIIGMGGGIYNQGRVELKSSTIVGNEGGSGGGGLDNHGAAFLNNSTISDNRGDGGGGISNRLEAVLDGCTVEGNSGGNGGGIFNRSDLLLKETRIRDNNAALGGGIYNDGDATVVDTHIVQNVTREGEAGSDSQSGKWGCGWPSAGGTPSGGGIFNTGEMTVDFTQISYNSTGDGGRGGNTSCPGTPGADGGNGGYGGGIYNSGSLELNLCSVIENNTGNGGMGGGGNYGNGNQGAGGAGGGVYNSGTMWINLGMLQGNQTGQGTFGGNGGALANEGELTLFGSVVDDNRTALGGDGGGIYANSPITISAATVISNTASRYGGGLALVGITGQVANSIVGHNKSGILGSGLYASRSVFNLENNTFAQNYGGDGSGLYASSSTLNLTNTILVSHTIGVIVTNGSLADLESTLWGSGAWANQQDWAGDGTVITGTHNYWEDPDFLDPTGLDYHITSASAAIDRGVNTSLNEDIDFQPRPNPASPRDDLGADDYWVAILIETVSVTGQPTVTRKTPITITATISPDTATPNILYYWRPPPVAGQWTENARYAWQRSGMEEVTVMAINAASAVSETISITVEPVYSLVYLPVIGRSPGEFKPGSSGRLLQAVRF